MAKPSSIFDGDVAETRLCYLSPEKARAAYARGEFAAALDLYSRVDPERLLRSDTKKIAIARRRARSDPSGLR